MHKLGILCSQFPEMHETFVIRELNALKNGGIDLRVYSLKPCRDKVIHEDSKALMASTYYPGHFMAVFFQAAGTLFRQPLPSLQTLFWTLSNNLFPVSGFIKSAVAWWISLAMVETIRKDGITHLHAHWANYPTTSAVILSKLLGIPFSFTAHAFDIFVRNPSLKPKLHLAEKIITCTDFNRRYLAQLVPECSGKILLNYHGVNTQKFKPESRDQALKSTELPLLLSIGRLVEQKGYEDLLTAYGKLLQKGGRFRALIIGGGPLQKKLSTRIRQLGLEKIVEMKSGYSQAQIKGFMQSAYAFVLPCVVAKNNDRDGIPNVILEAMSMGLPTVSTTVSGVPEAVWDQRTGLLVHERDPEMLYQALDLLLRNPVYTSQLGARAREFAIDKFSEFVHMKRLTWEMKKILRIVADSAHDPEETDAPLSHSRYSTQRPNPRAIKVAHIIWSLEIGGAERAVQAIAEGLDPENFRSIVICLNQEGRLSAALKAKGIPVFALRKKGAVDIAMLFRLIRILKNEKIEILHAHLFGASLWGRLAGKIAGIPILIAHEHGMQPWRKKLHFAIDCWLSRITQRILFVSDKVLDDYQKRTGISTEKLTLIKNGVRCPGVNFDPSLIRKKLGLPEPATLVISVGRLSPEKGHEDLVTAFAQAVKKFPTAHLILVGDGPERSRLEDLKIKKGLSENMTFAGTQDEVTPWLLASDIYVQPSRREGLSFSILEAMGAALPVIATKVGDVEKVIDHGRNGYLSEPNDPAALAGLLEMVLQQLPALQILRDNARRTILTQYSNRVMIDAVEAVYYAEIEKRQPHHPENLALHENKNEI